MFGVTNSFFVLEKQVCKTAIFFRYRYAEKILFHFDVGNSNVKVHQLYSHYYAHYTMKSQVHDSTRFSNGYIMQQCMRCVSVPYFGIAKLPYLLEEGKGQC
jgi:hypothetical protein